VSDREEFTAFVDAHARNLQGCAWLLTGDWSSAEDLAQTALAKTWTRWANLREPDAAPAYVRRMMYRIFLGWRRRRWLAEVSTGWLPEESGAVDGYEQVDAHGDLVRLVKRLPPGQRAVLVLRYFEDLTEQATADVLGCSVGTVKSQHARALAALRAMPELRSPSNEEVL
jgi:RNA polymerase sigma-70 factor (sigma-E family)